jgi:hypothetical protein
LLRHPGIKRTALLKQASEEVEPTSSLTSSRITMDASRPE